MEDGSRKSEVIIAFSLKLTKIKKGEKSAFNLMKTQIFNSSQF